MDQIFKVNSIALKEDSFAKNKGSNANYSFNSLSMYDINGYNRVTGTIDVGAEELRTAQIITATDLAKTYGELDFIDPSATVVSGLPLTYTKSSNVNIASIIEGNIHIIKPGTTNITISQVGNENYAPTEKTFTLTLEKAILTVKANDKTKFANNLPLPNADYDVSYTGFVNGDDSSKLTGTIQYLGSAIGKTEIGIYTDGIIPSGLSSNYYDFVYQEGTLKILPNTTLANNTLYVKQGAVGGDGSSWQLALNDLSEALRNASILNSEVPNAVNKIYVAKGTYTPKFSARDNANFIDEAKDNSFLLINDVKLYGGFDGNITNESIIDRNIEKNKTVLDGKSSIYHIITVSNSTGNNEIDGFTISKGVAATLVSDGEVMVNGELITRQRGAGIRVHSSNVTIKNCIVTENFSGDLGGGIYVTNQSNISIYNTLFFNNTVGNYLSNGTAIAINNANLKVVNVTFGDIQPYSSHITTAGVSNVEVLNSIFRADTGVIDVKNAGGANTITIKNSLLSEVKSDTQYSGMTLTNNIYKQPADFIDINANNYALKPTSVAIDAGDNSFYSSNTSNNDTSNNSRIINSTIDMGSYESKAVQTVTVTDITKKYTDADFIIGNASSGLPLTYTSDNKTVAYITKDNKIDIVGVGQTIITVTQNGNETYGSVSKSITLTVEKGDISTTLNPGTYTYDGSKKYLNISGLPTGASVAYEDNGQINVGEYNVKANITGGQNYNDITVSNTLKINKTVLSGISFPAGTFTYDGFDKHPRVSGILPEGVNVVYTNTQKNAGVYNNVKATISSSNFNVLELTTSMTISKGNLSDAIFLVEKEEIYDGTIKKLSLAGILPDGVTTTYINNDNINVGSYDVTVNLNGGVNYNDKQLIAKLKILKGNLVTNLVLAPNTYVYDGNQKSLTINGTLPNQVTVSYTNNNKIAIGNYKVYATLSRPNYNDEIVEADLIIQPKPLNVIAQGETSKVYNANTIVALNANNFTLEGVVNGENVLLINPVAGSLNTKNVGENKPVTINSLRLSGADSKNYALSATSLVANIAKITPKKLDVSLKGNVTKIYDETTRAVLTDGNFDINGILENNIVTLNAASLGEYDTKDIGENKTITVNNLTISGDDAPNYILSSQTTTGQIGEITKATITGITLVDASSVFDETAKSLSIVGTLPAGKSVSYANNSRTDVGIQEVTATISGTNYTTLELKANLTITKATITGITFIDASSVFDETAKSLSIAGTLPTGTSVSYANNSRTNVGTQEVTATISGTNYTTLELKADLTITRATITEITFVNESIVFDGTAKSLSIAGTLPTDTSVSYANNSRTDVGTQEVNATISGANYTTLELKANLTITKASISVITFVNESIVFDGTAKSLSIAGTLPTGTSVSYANNRRTNVGTQEVTATISGTNYTTLELKANLTITRATITGITFVGASSVFDETAKSLAIIGTLPTGISVSYANNSRTNVGTQEVTATISGTNYTSLELKADLTITRATITGITFADESIVFDGTAKSLSIAGTLPTGTLVIYANNNLTNVGRQEVTATISGANYTTLELKANLTITKASILVITFVNESIVFDGTAKSLSIAGTLPTGTSVSYANNSRTNVGTQEVTATISGTNYTSLELKADLTITRATITEITFADESSVFDETAKSLSITGTLPTGTSVSYANNSRTDVGTQEVTATIFGTNYTTLELKADLTITRATITGITFADESIVFDGTAKSLSIAGTLPTDTSVNYANNNRTDVGKQEVTATISGANYTTLVLTADLTITKATISGITFEDVTFTYDGTEKSIAVTNLPADATAIYENNGKINAESYNVKATVSRTNYEDAILTATLTINKAAQSITFNAIPTKSLENDADFQLNATASSTLPISYSFAFNSAQPSATVSATGFVELLSSGQITVTANQEGNANYVAATAVNRQFSVTSNNAKVFSITIDGVVYDNPPAEINYLIDCGNTVSSVDIAIESDPNANASMGKTFTIPTANPGIYRNDVTITSQDSSNTNTYKIIIEKVFQFEDIIVNKYDNTVIVNNNPDTNGGYSFASFKWYKNGQLVSQKQFFSEGDNASNRLDPNADYQAVMITESGDELRTCISKIKLANKYGLKILGNPVAQGSSLKVRADFPEAELKQAVFYIYDMNGRMIYNVKANGIKNDIKLPASISAGIYKLVLVTSKQRDIATFIQN